MEGDGGRTTKNHITREHVNIQHPSGDKTRPRLLTGSLFQVYRMALRNSDSLDVVIRMLKIKDDDRRLFTHVGVE